MPLGAGAGAELARTGELRPRRETAAALGILGSRQPHGPKQPRNGEIRIVTELSYILSEAVIAELQYWLLVTSRF